MFKFLNRLMVVLCYVPYVYLVAFYSFVVRATIKLKKIPSYENPDPKELGFDRHRLLIDYVLELFVYGLLVYTVLMLLTLLKNKFEVETIHWRLLGIGVLIVLFHFFVDPFFQWFVD